MYFHRDALGPVDLAFTDRLGGVSAAPFDELNLALTGDDEAEAVRENLALLLADFAPGAPLADMRQVHGNTVELAAYHAGAASAGAPAAGPPECDGLVTDRPGPVLMVRVADCVPVLLADADRGVVGVVHAGRPGLACGVVPATVARMRELGAEQITAWIGPHVCGGCYEVPADLQEQVAAVEPATRATTTWGTPALDLGAGVRAQLERDDVAVHEVSRCTRESADLYSYRRDGDRAGRLAGLIRVRG